MKVFVILSALVSVAMARPGLVQVGPHVPTLQSQISASASASSTPQELPLLLRLLPNVDGRGLDSLELSLARAEQEAAQQRLDAAIASDNARSALGLSPLVSASSSASASSLSPTVVTADGRVINSLDVGLANAVRLADQRLAAQAIQSQSQRLIGANPLLSTTRLAQSLASLSPAGGSSSSSVQVLESPELRATGLQQNVLLAQASGIQSNGLPVLVGSDGQVITSPLLVL